MSSFSIGHIDHDTIRMAYQSSDNENILDMIEEMTDDDIKAIAEDVEKTICESDILIDCADMAVQQLYVNKNEV